jgi:hypothetical protein
MNINIILGGDDYGSESEETQRGSQNFNPLAGGYNPLAGGNVNPMLSGGSNNYNPLSGGYNPLAGGSNINPLSSRLQRDSDSGSNSSYSGLTGAKKQRGAMVVNTKSYEENVEYIDEDNIEDEYTPNEYIPTKQVSPVFIEEDNQEINSVPMRGRPINNQLNNTGELKNENSIRPNPRNIVSPRGNEGGGRERNDINNNINLNHSNNSGPYDIETVDSIEDVDIRNIIPNPVPLIAIPSQGMSL